MMDQGNYFSEEQISAFLNPDNFGFTCRQVKLVKHHGMDVCFYVEQEYDAEIGWTDCAAIVVKCNDIGLVFHYGERINDLRDDPSLINKAVTKGFNKMDRQLRMFRHAIDNWNDLQVQQQLTPMLKALLKQVHGLNKYMYHNNRPTMSGREVVAVSLKMESYK